MVLHLLRVFFILVVLALTIPYAFKEEVAGQGYTYLVTYIMVPSLLAFAAVLIDILWHDKRLRGLTGLFFGILAGAVLAFALNNVISMFLHLFPRLLAEPTIELAIKLADAAIVFFCVTIVLQTRDDFRFLIPYVEFSRNTKGSRPLLLDTSVIIDGRIADIAETGMLEGEVVVPRFILTELQAVADSSDKLKRNRGRRGLDVLGKLQKSQKIDIRLLDAQAPGMQDLVGADAKLVALGKHLDGKVVTNDYNLNKIAQLRGVEVININDLANALKPVVLPGETLTVKVVKPGEEPGQGVGYLDDGTMVVAEGGREHIGSEIVIIATSVLQTSAGRMIFGRLDADKTKARNGRA